MPLPGFMLGGGRSAAQWVRHERADQVIDPLSVNHPLADRAHEVAVRAEKSKKELELVREKYRLLEETGNASEEELKKLWLEVEEKTNIALIASKMMCSAIGDAEASGIKPNCWNPVTPNKSSSSS